MSRSPPRRPKTRMDKEMIKLISLTSKDKIYFMGLDPLMLMDRMDLVGVRALGAVSEPEDGSETSPVGLMLFSESSRGYRIHWLCVSTDNHAHGIGSRLLAVIFDMSVKKNYSLVEAYFNEVKDRERLCPSELGFFASHLFTRRRSMPGEWHTTIGALEDTVKALNIPKNTAIIPLSQLDTAEWRNALTMLSKNRYAVAMNDVAKHRAEYDADVSMVIYADGYVTEGILVQAIEVTEPELVDGQLRPSGEYVLYPVLLTTGNKLNSIRLIERAVLAACGKYPSSTNLCVINNTSSLSELCNRLMPGCHIDSYRLIASVSEYTRNNEEDTDYYIL